ncbi:hypothetical protein [Chryseobacterium elymi]|uniref:hypothetical protein n=1 Tax=Chryseobacterium elymi TaxID=395936 RepID=UPI001EE7FB2B|nr:hypothetical protein [Chryseobacterium elymi]
MDKENRKLPEIEIEKTIFQFDIDRLALIEKDNPSNTISFAYMKDHGTHYSFSYSPLYKTHDFIMKGPSIDEMIDKILDPALNPSVMVTVPRITEIDPLGFSNKYNCTTKDMVEKTDFELMVNQEVYNKRIDGHPVKVNICGNEYVVDPDNDILWSIEGKPDIELKGLQDYYSDKNRAFNILYEPISGRVIDIKKQSVMDTETVKLVEIPDIRTIDPIGKNHASKLPLKFGLIYHDLKLEYDLAYSHDQISQIIPTNRNEQGQLELLIEGTTFIVDVNTFEFRDKFDPNNVIPLKEMQDCGDGYLIKYNDKDIHLPEFVVLDPAAMAKKYNVSIQEVEAHDDFHFMVDQKAFHDRMQGKLPTIDIEGHTFTVDIRMNMLRSASDFLSKGINFDDIDHYYSDEKDAYLIPYDPKKHEFRELDYANISSFPKDLIAIEFPFQTKLDPIGWNREGGWDLKSDLKWVGVQSHFEAKKIPWEKTFIVDVIKENKQKQQQGQNNQKTNKPSNNSKGRKM